MEPRDLYTTLHKRVGFEIVGETVSPNQIRIIGRLPQPNMQNWLVVLQRLLLKAEQTPWKVDVSKQYFVKNGKVFYAWRVIFQAEEIATHLEDIISTISTAPRARAEVDEVNLYAGENRNALRMGKGAQPSGKAIVGPMALVQMRQGS